MIPSLTIATMSSSSSNLPIDTTGSHDITHVSHDTSDGTHDTDGSCDSSSNDAVTTETDEDTIVQQRTNVKVDVSGSHDPQDDSSTTEENSQDPADRSVILNKIYQKYIRDRRAASRGQKVHRPNHKKV